MPKVGAGVVRGWHVVHLPAQATNFNVSAVVLPEFMPAADDGPGQLPMFGPDRVIRLLEDIAEAQLETAYTQRLLAEHLNGRTPEVVDRRRHVPHNRQFRIWSSFRSLYQAMEREVIRLGYEPTKESLYLHAGGPSVRTTTRIMVETYGLPADHWPPSTWPESLPSEGESDQI